MPMTERDALPECRNDCDDGPCPWEPKCRRALSTPPQAPGVVDAKAALIAGWNACRKSIYAVCEDVIEEYEQHRSDTENAPRHHFGRGGMSAAKSIARGFGALEAMDDNHAREALSTLVSTPPVSGEAGIDWGDLLAGYQRICSEHGIEPTSGDVLAALKRHDAGEPMIPMSPTPRENARAWAILQHMALERKSWWRRWFLPSEPLRNDAANLIREAKPPLPSVPNGTRLVGDAT